MGNDLEQRPFKAYKDAIKMRDSYGLGWLRAFVCGGPRTRPKGTVSNALLFLLFCGLLSHDLRLNEPG